MRWPLCLLLAFLHLGCSDDDQTPSRTRGFVEGTITGIRSDGNTPIEETFNYPNAFPNSNEISFRNEEQIITVTVHQTDDLESTRGNFFQLSFFQDRDQSEFDENIFGGTPFYPVIGFQFSRSLEGNRRFIFQANTSFINTNQFTSFEITNFNVDENRGEIGFNFTFVFPGDLNSTGNEATLSGRALVPYIEEVF